MPLHSWTPLWISGREIPPGHRCIHARTANSRTFIPPFDGAMSLDGSDNTDPPPSATLKLDVASMVRVEQPGNVLVFAQSTSTHFPVVRRTIGTQGTAELAGKRRRNPPTYTCGNCRTTFTTKANGVRESPFALSAPQPTVVDAPFEQATFSRITI